MFKQLTYFQSLEADLRSLSDTAATLNARLSDAYSSPDKVYCSLATQIDAILEEEDRLSSVLSVILQQVDCGTFVPAQPDHMLPLLPVLPEWFPHVLQTEYERVRGELSEYARSLAVLHELQQKRKAMREQRETLEKLFRRSVAISRNEQSTEIDIMQEVQHLRNRIRHVRKTFQHYCQQVANKIVEFVEALADRTASFSSPNNSALKTNVAPVSQIFKARDVLGRTGHNNWTGGLPEQSFRPHDNHKSISPRSHLTTYNPTAFQQPQQDYYFRSAQIKTKVEHVPFPHSQAQHTHVQHTLKSSCRNHQLNGSHRHSCELGRDWLRAAKSEERLKTATTKYDYRKYVPATSQYY